MRVASFRLLGVLFVFITTGADSAQLERPIPRESRERMASGGDLAELEANALAAEQKGDWQQAAGLYDQLSVRSRIVGQYQKAISTGKKAFDLATKTNVPVLQVHAALQLSRAYNSVRQDMTAIELL